MRPVDLIWAGGEHGFALDIGGLRAVQDSTNRGPMEIYAALGSGTWRIDDVLAVLRFGLIGGGMAPGEAKALMVRIVDVTPIGKLVATAHLVIAAALVGPADDPVGGSAGEPAGAAAPPAA